MKSSSAPNKTPSLKRPPAFFLPPTIPSFLSSVLFFPPALCCFYLTLGKHAFLICAGGGPPRKDDSGLGASVCLCAHKAKIAHSHVTEPSAGVFRRTFFAVNAGLYLHGSLWALCLLALACAPLILWAQVWNERRRPVADGGVRRTPRSCPPRPAGPTPHSLTLSPAPLSHLRLPALSDAAVLFPV